MILTRHHGHVSLLQSPDQPAYTLFLAAGTQAWVSDLGLAKQFENQVPPLLTEAIYDAHQWHAFQKYGEEPYMLHCWEVAHALDALTDNPTLAQRIAAWHHDLFEDTAYPSTTHALKYGTDATRMVDACTGKGNTRHERQTTIHAQLLANPDAIDIKLADRAINMKNSRHNPKLWRMYQKELPAWEELLTLSTSPRMTAFFRFCGDASEEPNHGTTSSISIP